MSRLIGETVIIRDPDNGYLDDFAVWHPGPGADVEVSGAVFIPQGGELQRADNGEIFTTTARVLLPAGVNIVLQNNFKIIVRGTEYVQAKPHALHVSPFGTGRGGIEIFINFGEVN